MIPFRVVFLTFSRAAAASSVLGISVTTCLTKFLFWISTRFELLRVPITLLTDYSLSDSDNWPDPSLHFFRQIATLLFQQRSTHLPRSMMFIIFDYLYYFLSMLQPETLDPKKFCWIETGSSTRWILAWFFKHIVRLPNPLLLLPTSSSSGLGNLTRQHIVACSLCDDMLFSLLGWGWSTRRVKYFS